MTKDRARKQATRQRAAVTGERYVVAQRTAAEPAPKPVGRLDALTHRVPGVPAHVEGGLQGTTSRRRNSNPTSQNPRHGEPRVLVAWQNWIARRLGAGNR
jgi:hypothetical protein